LKCTVCFIFLLIGQNIVNIHRPNTNALPPDRIIDHAQAAATSAGGGTAAFANASASPTSAASTTPATTLAALNTGACASAQVPSKEYIAPLANDLLGVVAGYLPSEDQFTFRYLNLAAKVATDRQIEALTMRPREAAALLKEGAAWPNLKQLTLQNYLFPELASFVEVLSNTRYAPFELVLQDWMGDAFTADLLKHLATLHLSALTLYPSDSFPLDRLSVLAKAAFPISLNVERFLGERDFHAVPQLPSLTSLNVIGIPSREDALALGSHPSLKSFRADWITSEYLLPILANPRLETLSLSSIAATSDEVNTAMTSHPSITSLELEEADDEVGLLTAILCNPIIRSLKLTPHSLSAPEMRHIAEMRSLHAFTLHAIEEHPEPEVDAMRALCGRPLDTLRFDGPHLNQATFAIAAAAHATSLTFQNNLATFDQAAVAALVANPHVTTLSFAGDIVSGGAVQLAAAPRLEKLSLDFVSAEETVESVQRAWVDAGKSLADLTVVVR
jgi:hypothetical protein